VFGLRILSLPIAAGQVQDPAPTSSERLRFALATTAIGLSRPEGAKSV
jgi:hypothetical protein